MSTILNDEPVVKPPNRRFMPATTSILMTGSSPASAKREDLNANRLERHSPKRLIQHGLEVGEALDDLGFEGFEFGDDLDVLGVVDFFVDDFFVPVD